MAVQAMAQDGSTAAACNFAVKAATSAHSQPSCLASSGMIFIHFDFTNCANFVDGPLMMPFSIVTSELTRQSSHASGNADLTHYSSSSSHNLPRPRFLRSLFVH